jgi:hypothetical protein
MTCSYLRSLLSCSPSSTANYLRLLMDSKVLVRAAPVCAFLLLIMMFVGDTRPILGWLGMPPEALGEENMDKVCPPKGLFDLVVKEPFPVICS